MFNFCTLFDINFSSYGISMYESLKKYCSEEFTLYIFAFCAESYNLLKDLNLDNVKIVSLNELETAIPQLVEAKNNRTKGEYCWTCASSTIKYCIEQFNLEQCTYLDSDIYFYSDPKILLNEMGDKSVLITEHRYTPEYDQTKKSGKYCVQFVSFKNNENGMKVLNYWVDKCIEWCYNKYEENRFGDQKYLDDWLERFEGVHVLEHLGGGVAPWNVQQYKIEKKENELLVNNQPLVFYHFHDIKFNEKGLINSSTWGYYNIDSKIKKLIYKPYIKKLSEISKKYNKFNENVVIVKNKIPGESLKKILKQVRKQLIKIKFGKNGYLIIFGKKII